MKIGLKLFYIFAIIASLFFASWCVLHNTIHFQGDLARDFLLFEEIAVTKKPVLIGPRTSMQGVFHGPAWLYLNLPVFILSKGNPVASGWFWVGLIALSIGVVYFVTKKLTHAKIALPAAALYALAICSSAPYLYNPFGAVFLAPLILYFFMRFMQKQKIVDLALSLFCIGLSIQFEMVWGVPILFIATLFILGKIIKSKKYWYLFSFGILTLPLATFILFDVRHQFIQFKSILRYVFGEPGKAKQHIDYLSVLIERGKEMLLVMPGYFSNGSALLPAFFAVLFVVLIYLFYKFVPLKKRGIITYALSFYIGFWILTLPLKGIIYDYYYWAFLPLFCIALVYIAYSLTHKYADGFFVVLVVLLIAGNVQLILKQDQKFFSLNTGLWNFYKGQAEKIYTDAGKDFGWYVYTADQYAYSFKYAMSYVQTKYPDTKASKFDKKPLTYLMIYPSDNKYTNETGWKTGQVKINKKPVKVIKSIGGSYAEKYILTQEEQAVQADSSLLQDLTFR